MSAFEAAFKYAILENEGGAAYTNDPADSGGPTKYGVTLASYSAFLGVDVTAETIRNLTDAQAYAFYIARYWAPLKCHQVRDPALAIALFDTGVLHGVGMASLLAQKALCWLGANLKLDGHIGDKTLAALNLVKREDFLEALQLFIFHRIESVIKLNPKNERFRRGWHNRADRLLTLGTYTSLNKA